MPVKIRLSRKGRKKAPFYHIVIADSRSPRDGKFIEKIGTYNPMTRPATIEVDRMAAFDWLSKGAQPTDTVKAILRFKGVYYRKHLMRGVKKGALTMENAEVMWQSWIDAKEQKIASRKSVTLAEMESLRKMISGEAKVKAVVADEATKQAAEAFIEKADTVTEEAVQEMSEVIETAAEITEDAIEVVEEKTASVGAEVAETVEAAVEETKVAVEPVADVAETIAEDTTEAVVVPEQEKTEEDSAE
ncbi:MAG: 30S ribosomal protein S16 [Saprospiraceae bacterium]